MRKKLITLLCVMCLFAAVLSSCGKEENAKTSELSASPKSEAELTAPADKELSEAKIKEAEEAKNKAEEDAKAKEESEKAASETKGKEQAEDLSEDKKDAESDPPAENTEVENKTVEEQPVLEAVTEIYWNPEWEFADFSIIHDSPVYLYRAMGDNRKNIVVGINAGHGTSGGEYERTMCHPDGSPKVTGGSTAEGSTTATAIAAGTTFLDGMPESMVTLWAAQVTKNMLLEAGYDVLMIRDAEDTQLDNIARTVFCNNNAQCHISIHFDSTDYDKGLYAMTVPGDEGYMNMYPVSMMWQQHDALAECLVSGAEAMSVNVWDARMLPTDLTQTSYSTVPSVDVEVGDRATDYSDYNLSLIASGLVRGVDIFFGY